jgi:serine/threonine-protein kinase
VLGSAPQTDDPELGHEFGGRYRLLRILGQGGLGVVYEAVQEGLGRKVAIKVLREEVSRNETVLQRFRQEAKSASLIGHENIVDIIEFGETVYGAPYLVMEMLEGEDLAHRLKRERTISMLRILTIARQCCRALTVTHEKGIVHRDMKPENIFLVERDEQPDFVKIVDFGIAKMNDLEQPGEPGRKLTKTGMIFGTPEYMSPEQAAGKPSDHRVDIYAMGIILFEMITGRVPFVGDSFMAVLTQHLLEPVPQFSLVNPSVQVPPDLEAIVQRALQKHPDHRFQTMNELGDALQAVMDGTPLKMLAPMPTDPPPAALSEPSPFDGAITDEASQSAGPRLGWLWVLLASLGVGLGSWFITDVMGPSPADVGSLDASSSLASDAGQAVTADASPPDAALPDSAPPDAAPVEAERVEVRIVSRPPGARLVSPRLGCSSTPCTVRMRPGARVTLRLSSGTHVGLRGIRVRDEAMTVSVPMRPCCNPATGLRCPPQMPQCF